jgi:hypothetical protein
MKPGFPEPKPGFDECLRKVSPGFPTLMRHAAGRIVRVHGRFLDSKPAASRLSKQMVYALIVGPCGRERIQNKSQAVRLQRRGEIFSDSGIAFFTPG